MSLCYTGKFIVHEDHVVFTSINQNDAFFTHCYKILTILISCVITVK